MVGSSCSAVNCSNSSAKFPDLAFFRVPKNPKRCKKWIVNSRRQDLMNKSAQYCYTNIRFCTEHFEKHMFLDPKSSRLVWNAEPTVFEIPNPPPLSLPKRRHLYRYVTAQEEKIQYKRTADAEQVSAIILRKS
jgi:hypothetical protein